jgi:hypothetical protein
VRGRSSSSKYRWGKRVEKGQSCAREEESAKKVDKTVKKGTTKRVLCDEKSKRGRFGLKRMGSRRGQKERAYGEATLS